MSECVRLLMLLGVGSLVVLITTMPFFVSAQEPASEGNVVVEQVNGVENVIVDLSAEQAYQSPEILPPQEQNSVIPQPALNETSVSVKDEGGTKKIMIDSFDLRDMEIKDVLKLISSKTGLNIVAGGNIAGRITMFMQNIEIHDALRIILEANDLAYVEQDGMIRIMSDQDFEKIYGYKFGLKTERRVFTLKGMKPSDALALLVQVKSAVGKVIADDQSGTVLVEDTPEMIARMEEYLNQIDAAVSIKVFELQYIQAEELSKKIQDMLTPKLGTVRFDLRSNKVFVKDVPEKIKELEVFVREVDMPRSTEVFELSYVKAEAMIKLIQPILTESMGRAEFDAPSNKIIVTDTTAKMAEIARIINAIDRKQKEVLIEARIVQITLDDKFRMGVDWEALASHEHDVNLSSKFTNLSSVTTKGALSVGTLSEDHYASVLQALDEKGKTRVLSNPKIAVINNEEARILIGSTKPYVTTTTTANASGPPTTAEAVNFIDVGVKLHVTPVIHNDGYITMKIKPEVSSAATSLVTSTQNEIPIVETSEVETVIRVKDGVTIVLGGLMKEEKNDSRKGIPLLSKIPIMGAAFRNIDRSDVRTEIVLFLTPRIITGDISAPEAHDPAYSQSKK